TESSRSSCGKGLLEPHGLTLGRSWSFLEKERVQCAYRASYAASKNMRVGSLTIKGTDAAEHACFLLANPYSNSLPFLGLNAKCNKSFTTRKNFKFLLQYC